MRDRSIRIDDIYKWLVKIYVYKYTYGSVQQLDLDIEKLQHGEKSRERAVLELALHLGLEIFELRELKKKGLSEKEAISEFLKGQRIHLTVEDPEIQQILAKARDEIYKPSPDTYVTKEKPSVLWYLGPLFFAILGGLIAYVGVKSEDEEMAKNLLFLGFIISVVDFLLLWFLS
jgi:hypothetical protein